jgi:hypothetical protein
MPFFVVIAQQSDPRGERLVKRVRWIAKTCTQVAAPVKGVMRRLADGSLSFATSADLDLAAWTLACAQADCPELEDVLLVKVRGTSFVESQRVVNLSAQAAAMRQIVEGEKGWFCFVQDGKRTAIFLDTARA